jgi:periplasmic protein CpxP/Spy
MKTKFWMFTVAMLAVLLCGTVMFSYAQQTDSGAAPAWAGHRHGGQMGYMFKKLNLTDAQKAQVKSIMQANRATNRPLMQQMAQNRLAMLTATSNGAFDQAKVTALATQQAQLMAQMAVQRETIQHQIYTQVLTPEQQATANQMRQNQINRITEHLQKLSQSGTEPSGQ